MTTLIWGERVDVETNERRVGLTADAALDSGRLSLDAGAKGVGCRYSSERVPS